MRVGLFLPQRSSGGLSNLLTEVSDRWQSVRPADELVHIADGNAPDLGAADVEVRSAGATGLRAGPWFDLQGGRDFLDEADLDVLLCAGNRVPRCSAPTVWWPQTVATLDAVCMDAESVSPRSKARFAGIHQMIKASARRADATVYTSAYARGLFTGNFHRLQRLPSLVIQPPFSIDPTTTERSPIEVPEPYILCVSMFNRYKRVIEAIEGFAKSDGSSGHHLVLAGGFPDPSYETSVRSAISRFGLEDRVSLLGFRSRPEIATLYEKASAFLFTSTTENAGAFCLLDAFAFGLPIASSQMSSMPEMNGQAVIPLDPTNPLSVADALDKVVDPALALEYRSRALSRAGQSPTWDDAVRQLADFVGDFVSSS